MIEFTTSDGLVFFRQTHVRIVLEMSKLNWYRDQPKRGYMEDVLDRVQQITGVAFTGKLTSYRFLRFLHEQQLGKLRVIY